MVTCSFEGFMTRLGILVVGVFFGFNTLILGMMADSGTTLAVTFAAIATLGSALVESSERSPNDGLLSSLVPF